MAFFCFPGLVVDRAGAGGVLWQSLFGFAIRMRGHAEVRVVGSEVSNSLERIVLLLGKRIEKSRGRENVIFDKYRAPSAAIRFRLMLGAVKVT